jgi:small-conductance mechanosensitive channel
MKFLEKIKKIFKIGDNSKQNRDDERISAEKRLNGYLAEEQKRKKAFEQKQYEELQAKNPYEERIAAEKRLTEYLAEQNTQKKELGEIHNTFPVIEKTDQIKYDSRIGSQEKSVKDRNAQESKNSEDTTERMRHEKFRVEEQRKLDENHAEAQRIKAEEQRERDEIYVEEQRIKADEQRKLDEITAKERKILEKERLKRIHGLYHQQFSEYLREAEKFRSEFGKNVKCDICGKWDSDLHVHRNQTYCEKHIPLELHRENERKITAGRHGASKDFIKK